MYEELVKELRLVCEDERFGGKFLYLSLINRAADAIEDLEFACNRYEKDYKALCAYLPKWIPVTERLPKPMKYVLLVIRRMGKEFRHDPFISTGYMSINKVDWWCSHDGSCSANHVEVTHWMPLPEPPKEEQTE